MMSRITMNQIDPLANATVVWIDIAAGTNTVRLDNVGLINGGIGVRMDSPSDDPAGVSPGRPLFLLANDLEIDFPLLNAIELSRGEEVQLSNCYVQGSKLRNGIYVAATWNSEIQIVRAVAIHYQRRAAKILSLWYLQAPAPDSQLMHCHHTQVNSRIFGHNQSGIVLGGGAHALISNNMIGDNSVGGVGQHSGVLVLAGASDFILSTNHIGAVFKGQASSAQKAGVEIEAGVSDGYVVQGNTLTGNAACLLDGGTGTHKVVSGNVCIPG
jgi:hypothetical protein